MKICQACGQPLSENVSVCPACGQAVGEGRRRIDGYRLLAVLHEGYSSILCKAVGEDSDKPVAIRIFNPDAGVTEAVADRLKRELEVLKTLPEDYFVQHLAIRRSAEGHWYRVSEWLDVVPWSRLVTTGRLKDAGVLPRLFHRIAAILDGLHQTGHFMPHLILSDVFVLESETEDLPVKIDYKVSRFLDPRLDRPGPMLKKLLESHPDIRNRRPLDPRSDIWSLGKLFVELLTGDLSVTDYRGRVDTLPAPAALKELLRLMLEEDPDMRPQAMGDVARAIEAIPESAFASARLLWEAGGAEHLRLIGGLHRRVLLFALLPGIALAAALAAWLVFDRPWEDDEARLQRIANRYATSVAFVVADYWLEQQGAVAYRGRTEGTAFLADREGYLLTNRHVACPWLEDRRLFMAIHQLKAAGEAVRFRYRLYLWFEGAKAFKRLPGEASAGGIEDVYHTREAFRSDGVPRVTIAGVARPPEKTWQAMRSPLKDDFAVLRVDPLPDHLEPLPLDTSADVRRIPRLAPVIALGFPLGSQTLETTVNVSVTTGHVRRTFDTLLQVDTSLYRGNSGGPVIDAGGKVVGIASSVAVEFANAPIPVATLLSDIGMVLPVAKAARFLSEVKQGRFKWKGDLHLEAEETLALITRLADQGRWAEARKTADDESRLSGDPTLLMASAMLAFCVGDGAGARDAFLKALSLDPDNQNARFMAYLLDWLDGRKAASPHRATLLALDWRSPHEFLGHLARMMESGADFETATAEADSDAERVWLHFLAGTTGLRRDRLEAAEAGFRAALRIADRRAWLYYLSLSRLEAVRRKRADRMAIPDVRERYRLEVEASDLETAEVRQTREALAAELEPVRSRLGRPDLDLDQRRLLLETLAVKDTGDRRPLVELAFVAGMQGRWSEALAHARAYLSVPGRETGDRLRLRLLEPQLLNLLDQGDAGRTGLRAFVRETRDAWYRTLAECLLADGTEDALSEKAGEDPAYLVTGYTALGLWAEGAGDGQRALRSYKEALGSYMDETLEYALARERIRALR